MLPCPCPPIMSRVCRPTRGQLQGAVTSEDFDFFLGPLSLRTMPGPDSLPYELLKSSLQQFKEQIFKCINAILLKCPQPHGWVA